MINNDERSYETPASIIQAPIGQLRSNVTAPRTRLISFLLSLLIFLKTTTMDITFNPPIGDSIQLETSFSLQTTLLHFTAELTVLDHNKLIQDHARIQLWSDLAQSDGEWGALDFTYQTQATEESSQISLGSTCPKLASEKVTLFLEVVAPLPMGRNSHFSFTYRIFYPSGDIQWLGPFGQNGSLSFERSDHDLHNFGLHSWTFDKSRMAHVYEVKEPVAGGTLVVAKVRDVSNYCVRAMGPTRCLYLLNICARIYLISILVSFPT